MQAALTKWVEKNSQPKLVSLDRTPKNKKALQKVFADKLPKVLGVMPADDKHLKEWQDALIKASESVDGVHVRI